MSSISQGSNPSEANRRNWETMQKFLLKADGYRSAPDIGEKPPSIYSPAQYANKEEEEETPFLERRATDREVIADLKNEVDGYIQKGDFCAAALAAQKGLNKSRSSDDRAYFHRLKATILNKSNLPHGAMTQAIQGLMVAPKSRGLQESLSFELSTAASQLTNKPDHMIRKLCDGYLGPKETVEKIRAIVDERKKLPEGGLWKLLKETCFWGM